MLDEKTPKIKKSFIFTVGIIVFIILSLAMILFGIMESGRSKNPSLLQVTFVGEYKIGNGQWKPIEKGKHIPADKGDVTLDGYFRIEELETDDPQKQAPFDTAISLYMNHISVTIYEPGSEYPIVLEAENEYLGEGACGQLWEGYSKSYDFKENLQIVIHNPHQFGNATAVDDFLDSMYVYASPTFEKTAEGFGTLERGVGIVVIILAFMILGVAVFSVLLRTRYARELIYMGFLVLFGGVYFLFSSEAVYFWSNTVVLNTMAKGVSAMFYMLFAYLMILNLFKGKEKIIGEIVTAFMGIVGIICVSITVFTDVYFYDVQIYWTFAAALSGLVLLGCLVATFKKAKGLAKMANVLSICIILAFLLDVVATYLGLWQGGFMSRNAFIVVFAVEVIVIMQIIPKNINAVFKAKQLEAEKASLNAQLAESRISTMMSQIRPHFIYNTLGSIEQLCELDPKKAGELVHNFAKYLRGNFGELDNPKPISISREMEHVKYYVSIENVRFPDMTFTFEQTAGDFEIPALTIQPVVENSIKHGLLKLSKGGSVYIKTYETDTHYCVSVVDDGVGFDPTILQDPRKHVGMRNIRERLEIMVGGTMEVESAPGEGTKTLISIPKKTPGGK